MPTIEEVRALLVYNADDGTLRWRVTVKSGRVGAEAGGANGDGYKQVGIAGRRYMTHRVAWLLHHGKWPDGVIDHINGDRGDNRICNLRDTTVSVNCANRKHDGAAGRSRLLGAQWNSQKQCWQGAFKPSGKPRIFLGLFDTAEDAHAAYLNAISEKKKKS